MDKKVMTDLLAKGHDGNSILQILDALCDGMDYSAGGETSDTVNQSEELADTLEEELVESQVEELVEA